jgi:hypothetical protein
MQDEISGRLGSEPDGGPNAPVPLDALIATSLAGGDSDTFTIEEHEEIRAAQQDVWALLPVDTQGQDAGFEQLGFEFGARVAHNPVLRRAKLPRGWTLRMTGDDYWLDLLDESKTRRAAVFYRASGDDRIAFMVLRK